MRKISRTLSPAVPMLLLALASGEASAQQALPDGKLGFGTEGLSIPTVPDVNETTVRTVTLIDETYARTPDLSSKVRLLRDLGSTRLPSAVQSLAKHASDPEPLIRAEVARAIGVAKAGGAEVLKPMLNDVDPSVRREVILAGAALGDASFASVGLSDADASVRMAAIRSTSSPLDAEALSVRLPRFTPEQQVEAIKSIGRLGTDRPHADSVVGFLEGNVAQRAAAIEALGRLRATRFADRAVKLLDDAHPTVRRAATAALVGLEDEAARRGHALGALNDPDASVRAAAALVLVTAPDASVVEPLTTRLIDPYAPLRDAARQALLASARHAPSSRATIDAAVVLLADTVASRRADASWLLGEVASDAGFPSHLALLNDPSAAVVAQAAKSLGQIGNPTAGDALIALVTKLKAMPPSEIVTETDLVSAHANAIVSAALLQRKDVLPLVIGYVSDKEALATPRAAAIWAHGFLDAQDVAPRLIRIINDPMQGGSATLESIKALGNLRSPAAKKLFSGSQLPPALVSGMAEAYLTHWATDRVNGTTTPYSPTPNPYRANTSVRDLQRN